MDRHDVRLSLLLQDYVRPLDTGQWSAYGAWSELVWRGLVNLTSDLARCHITLGITFYLANKCRYSCLNDINIRMMRFTNTKGKQHQVWTFCDLSFLSHKTNWSDNLTDGQKSLCNGEGLTLILYGWWMHFILFHASWESNISVLLQRYFASSCLNVVKSFCCCTTQDDNARDVVSVSKISVSIDVYLTVLVSSWSWGRPTRNSQGVNI